MMTELSQHLVHQIAIEKKILCFPDFVYSIWTWFGYEENVTEMSWL